MIGREALGDRPGRVHRVQRVAERGDGAGDGHGERCDERPHERPVEATRRKPAPRHCVARGPRSERDGAGEQARVHEMHGHDHGARERRIFADEAEQHQRRADEGFDEHQQDGGAGEAAGDVARRKSAAREHRDGDDEQER